jgi:hypothetical protein
MEINTSKASKWLGMSDRTIRRLCVRGRLKGAYQPSGYAGHWLVPVSSLQGLKPCPEELQKEIMSALSASLSKE